MRIFGCFKIEKIKSFLLHKKRLFPVIGPTSAWEPDAKNGTTPCPRMPVYCLKVLESIPLDCVTKWTCIGDIGEPEKHDIKMKKKNLDDKWTQFVHSHPDGIRFANKRTLNPISCNTWPISEIPKCRQSPGGGLSFVLVILLSALKFTQNSLLPPFMSSRTIGKTKQNMDSSIFL